MIIFHNPGLLPLDAIRLMGASVKAAGSFGQFGTGLKYAVATVLRGGGSMRIWRGADELRFECREVKMRAETFEEVVLVNPAAEKVENTYTPLGFTTALGKDWEPWMVLRELACNARDEGGDFQLIEARTMPPCFSARDGETVVVVDWPELDAAATGDERVFATGELLYEEAGVRVLAGPSNYLYHRGVRVWKLPKPSVFTYDIISPVNLTEDRTVKYGFCVVANVRNMLLATSDRTLIAAAVTAGKKYWEGDFDWTGKEWAPRDPGHVWLEEVAVLRSGNRSDLSKSATDVFLAHSAYQSSTQYGGSYEEPTGVFGEAVEVLGDLGIRLDLINTFVADELPGETLSMIKGGSVYVTKSLLECSRYTVAREMLSRFLELNSGGNHDDLLAIVVPLFLDLSYELKQEREIAEAREAGLRPNEAEAFLGLHPVIDHREEPAPGAPDF